MLKIVYKNSIFKANFSFLKRKKFFLKGKISYLKGRKSFFKGSFQEKGHKKGGQHSPP